MRFAAPFEFPVLRVFDCEGAVPHCQERSPLGLTRPPGGLTDDDETAL